MKNLLLLTLLLGSVFCKADESYEEVVYPEFRSSASEKAPAPFQDSDIKRKLKDGSVQQFDGNKYMIVKRGAKSPKVAPVVVNETKIIKHKNRVSLLAGRAPDGDLSVSGRTVYTEPEFTVGLQYQRVLTERFNVGIQVQTNESVFGSIGLDF